MLKKTLLLTLIFAAFNASYAKTHTPQSDDVVLASDIQPVNKQFSFKDIEQAQTKIIELLSLAGQPGNSQNFLTAQQILNNIDSSRYTTELWYLKARIDQYLHHFEKAQESLQTVFNQAPNHVNGRLMAARLALMQRQPNVAKSNCLKILNHSDIMIVNICLLESMSYLGQLDDSYQQLGQLLKNNQTTVSLHTWVTLMVADMTQRLAKPQQVADWLDRKPSFDNSAYLIAWADAHIALNESKRVYKQLSQLTAPPVKLSTGLLMRLAYAENHSHINSPKGPTYWQDITAERLQRHILRDDKTHAGDIAYYFINLKPDAKKAQHWAQLNWQQAKEFKDEQLLNQANAMKTP